MDNDYDLYIQELTVNGAVSQSAAEQYAAGAVCAYMNQLSKNSYSLYIQAVAQRCKSDQRLYVAPSGQNTTSADLPLDLFTANITTNKFDGTKWNATIQDYLLQHMPLSTSTGQAPADKRQEIMNRLTAADVQIDNAYPLEADIPPAGRSLFAPVVPFAIWAGPAIATIVIGSIGYLLGKTIRSRGSSSPMTQSWPASPPNSPGNNSNPTAPPTTPTTTNPGSGTNTTGSSGPSSAPPPAPPPAPLSPEEQIRKRNDRNKKRDRYWALDSTRKARKDYYFGYVDRIQPVGSATEIRVEAIPENSLSDEIFTREIQKLIVAAGAPSYGLFRLAIISIYVHDVPAGVEEGQWINFKVDTSNQQVIATGQNVPDLSGTFTDGVTVIEPLQPTISFLNLRPECYLADNDGQLVKTDLQTVTKDITANALATLQAVFSTLDYVTESVLSVLDQFMNAGAESDDVETLGFDGDGRALGMKPKKAPTATKTRTRKVVKPGEASLSKIQTTLLPNSEEITKYMIYNVGQGHSARALSGNNAMFANDFGYGRVGVRKPDVCSHMIVNQANVPILLSHWDADHFRIAKSPMAKHYSGTKSDVTRRFWIAPGASHVAGPVTHEFAWTIQSNNKYLQWPESSGAYVQSSNIMVMSCLHNKQYAMPDKNNFGALALAVGTGDNIMLYPGDANFESIAGIRGYEKKLRSVIATHHGSKVALQVKGGGTGSSIPQASSGEAYVLFSYAKGNTYGHDVDSVYSYYKDKGYGELDSTAYFKNEDTLEVQHFGAEWARRLQQSSGSTSIPGQIKPGFSVSSIPKAPSNWPQLAQAEPRVSPDTNALKQFPSTLTLTGSGQAALNSASGQTQDDLRQFAVTNKDGDIVLYDIVASKIVLQNLPLRVPCITDYPVTVQISCRDIEFRDTNFQATNGFVPLVLFDVASGFEWTNKTAGQVSGQGQNGEPGDPGYAGGRLRLAVAGGWIRAGGAASGKGISILYRGGKGGSGQNGGDGAFGRSGPDPGLMPMMGRAPTVQLQAGTDGGNGGNGGDAGAPGTIGDSEVLALSNSWPAGWTVVIDKGVPGTATEFGQTGTPGRAGSGMPGGKGSKYFGTDGKPYDRTTAPFTKAKANLKMIATEVELLDQIAAVDWRYK
ncbi:hypothetical protein COCMIDRAFT_41496 [Bipolaris oryzae ATCC 44560]|uniref:Uncharacterized protein n=1 Tax=Bipolaris oryzae ATCC 44560 TaxID=930090 RepID=W6YX75_COCMI|nr:uncharacterized protein COCMIDRAFT_41496 [Bipolaris oryzae ATCC 44560]EUC40124.1 hypothetical protein COCMIDRAFT_41496 [Bipolaris oryzae ATCC 44560]